MLSVSDSTEPSTFNAGATYSLRISASPMSGLRGRNDLRSGALPRPRAECPNFVHTRPKRENVGLTMSASASFLSDFWHDQLVAHDRQALFLVLISSLAAFGFIRVSARLSRSPRFAWWPGSVVSESGVHLHHLVWGICLMIAGGALGFALFSTSPGREICAVVFGIGTGFTIDEFALWVYLDDVCWSDEGRSSIDAVVVAAALMLLVLVGGRPFDVATNDAGEAIATTITATIVIALVVACFAKQRVFHGVLGAFVLPVAIYGASRIGKPGSPWAKRFYGERKEAKAQRRFAPGRRTDRVKERIRDAIGGPTDAVYQTRQAATRAAAAEVQQRAERVAAADSPRRGPND